MGELRFHLHMSEGFGTRHFIGQQLVLGLSDNWISKSGLYVNYKQAYHLFSGSSELEGGGRVVGSLNGV